MSSFNNPADRIRILQKRIGKAILELNGLKDGGAKDISYSNIIKILEGEDKK